jgi:hypothetical protein
VFKNLEMKNILYYLLTFIVLFSACVQEESELVSLEKDITIEEAKAALNDKRNEQSQLRLSQTTDAVW